MRSGIWGGRSSMVADQADQCKSLVILNLFEMSSSTSVWNQRSPLIQSHCFMNTCTECSGCSQIRQMVVFWLPSILFHFPWQTLQCTANAAQSPSYWIVVSISHNDKTLLWILEIGKRQSCPKMAILKAKSWPLSQAGSRVGSPTCIVLWTK